MKNLFKKAALMVPVLLIGSAATIGMYAHASSGSTTPTVGSSTTVQAQDGEHASGPDTDNIQSGAQGPDVQDATAEASTGEQASANDPVGGPNDQVNQTGNHQDATPDAPESGTTGK